MPALRALRDVTAALGSLSLGYSHSETIADLVNVLIYEMQITGESELIHTVPIISNFPCYSVKS